MTKFAAANKQKQWQSYLQGYLFISPWLLGFFLLTFWPMLQSLYFSFTDYSLLEAEKWIGTDNYHKILFDDSSFINSIKATFIFVLLAVPIKLAGALLIAVVLNMKLKGMFIYRTVIYFPSLIGSSVAVAILWSNLFGRDGLINQLLLTVGIEGMNWIGIPQTALLTLIILAVWQFGSSMVIFLAGLKQIPHELYEAAAVDGAGKVRSFFAVTLPMLSPIILFNLVLQTIGAFQMFTQAFIITRGGPLESTYMYALYLFEKAFTRYQMGYASALAWILLLIIGVVTALIFFSSKRWVHYETEGGK
ncbi:carbohydrate ABC transporter permease [Paenibacillus sp. FSL H7-0331]|uniref:carbohydrate ABC transporter permease n=1 Tax=Paenibacillus sp. FSL H7-0331 TaxID=1920421 RepID=UPI00096D2795|nr:sugar ABC transporter permease [Paenibacillus sp. FSL H7-0331]OMF05822.1 ABC transporter permease [Paenibacillus sp. FSL H7-0331]